MCNISTGGLHRASATLANLIQGGVLVGDVTGDDRHDIVLPFETDHLDCPRWARGEGC